MDTCAISEFKKPIPNLGFLTWFARNDERAIYLSALTIGELRYGIALLDQSKKRTELERWLVSDVISTFGDRVLPIDSDVSDGWGRIRAQARKAGTSVPVLDALLAATSLTHNLSLVTCNETDFKHTGARVVNPWAA